MLAATPTPPAEQQAQPGAVYAELHEPDATTVGLGAVWNRHSMRDFADRTHALRMQAATKAAPVTQQAGYAEVIECGNSYAKVKLKGEAFGSARVGDIFYTALQQDEPVGEVVSASCDHATVRWLHQTSSVGGGDPRNSRAWPKVSGVSRDEGHSRALLVFFAAEPTDDEVRAVHDTLAAAPTAQAAPQPAPATQQAGDVVAYLDVGAGGYLDLGSELSEDALQQLPKGRHALVIAGTYGIDGYVAAPQPSPTTKPAPQQEAQEPCPTCVALARTVMLDQVSFDRKPDCYGIRQITDDESVEEWEDIRTSPDVAREEANDMMATGRGEIYEVVPLWTTPQLAPQPAPDCHHRPPCDECAAIAAQGGK